MAEYLILGLFILVMVLCAIGALYQCLCKNQRVRYTGAVLGKDKKNIGNKISKYYYYLDFTLRSLLDVGENSEQRRPILGSVGLPSYNSVASPPLYNYSGASTSATLVTPIGVQQGVAVGGVSVGVGGAPGGGVTVVNFVDDYSEDDWLHRNRYHRHHYGHYGYRRRGECNVM